MTTYHFVGAVAYDRLGSSWRTAAGLRSVSVTDPATGLIPANLVQGGLAVTWLTADANSRYSFTCDVPGVVVDFGAGAEALYANEVPGLAIAAGGVTSAQVDARMKWAPSTAYTLGQQILSPNSDVVKANVAHTSAAAYATDVAKWDLSITFGKRADIVYRVADYANAQAAIDAAPAGSVVLFPAGNTAITTALSITKTLVLRGSAAFNSRIYANAVNGVEVAAGVTDFHMETIEVAAQVRYTTTANTLVGILVNGTTGSRPANHVYRDVYVDGFQTAFRSGYLWSSVFDNFRCNYGLIGLDIYGLSVNNFVTGGGQISVAVVAGSRGIRFAGQESLTDATDVASEGWHVAGNLIDGGEVGVEIIGNTHMVIADNIIDHAQIYGVRVKDNGTHFGGNSSVHDNYVGMTGAGGIAAIGLGNTVSNTQNRGNRVHDNHCIAYAGATCTYGVYVDGSNAKSNIHDNVLDGFSAADIRMQIAGNRVVGNECLSAAPSTTANIYSTFLNEVANNTGIVYWPGGSTPVSYVMVGRFKRTYAAAAPTTGTWIIGDECANTVPAVGSPKAWLCTVAGTPGTWVSTGNLT